jgi:hypothetical protein
MKINLYKIILFFVIKIILYIETSPEKNSKLNNGIKKKQIKKAKKDVNAPKKAKTSFLYYVETNIE